LWIPRTFSTSKGVLKAREEVFIYPLELLCFFFFSNKNFNAELGKCCGIMRIELEPEPQISFQATLINPINDQPSEFPKQGLLLMRKATLLEGRGRNMRGSIDIIK